MCTDAGILQLQQLVVGHYCLTMRLAQPKQIKQYVPRGECSIAESLMSERQCRGSQNTCVHSMSEWRSVSLPLRQLLLRQHWNVTLIIPAEGFMV